MPQHTVKLVDNDGKVFTFVYLTITIFPVASVSLFIILKTVFI